MSIEGSTTIENRPIASKKYSKAWWVYGWLVLKYWKHKWFLEVWISNNHHSWSSAWLADRKGFKTGDANFYKALHMCLKLGSHYASQLKHKKGPNFQHLIVECRIRKKWNLPCITVNFKDILVDIVKIFPIFEKSVFLRFLELVIFTDICVWCW